MALNMDKIKANARKLAAFSERVKDDPDLQAQVYLELACPKGVSKRRYGIALRTASDMLHAPRSAVNSDSPKVGERKPSTPVLPACQTIIIIPQGDKLRSMVGSSPMKWTIHQLRYSKGCLAIKDDGTETETFPNVERLLSTIKQYGFSISKVTK